MMWLFLKRILGGHQCQRLLEGLRTGQTLSKDGGKGGSRVCAEGFSKYKLGKKYEHNV